MPKLKKTFSLLLALVALAGGFDLSAAQAVGSILAEPIQAPGPILSAPALSDAGLSESILPTLVGPAGTLVPLSSWTSLSTLRAADAASLPIKERISAARRGTFGLAAHQGRIAIRRGATNLIAKALRDFPKLGGLNASESRAAGDRLMDQVLGAQGIVSEAGLPEPARTSSSPSLKSGISRASAGRLLSSLSRVAAPLRISQGGLRRAAAFGVAAAAVEALFGHLAFGPASIAFEIYKGVVLFWALVGSLTLHEAAHAWTAEKVGDVSARMAGQVSINPWRYMNPASATMLFVTSMLGLPFGVFFTVLQPKLLDPANKKRMAVVALAGPAMNLALGAGLIALVLGVKLVAPGLTDLGYWLNRNPIVLPPYPLWRAIPWVGGTLRLLLLTAFLNFLLGVSNLIPLGPLDGQRVLRAAVPDKQIRKISLVNVFDALTVPLGLLAVLGLMVWAAIRNAHHGLAATPFGHMNSPFIMTLMAMSVVVWAVAMIPWVKEKIAQLRAYQERARILATGGYAARLAVVRFKGKLPTPVTEMIQVAIPWRSDSGSGPAESLRGLELESVAELADMGILGMQMLDLSTGRTRVIDQALLDAIRLGDYLVVRAKRPEGPGNEEFWALLPAVSVGRSREVRSLVETESAGLAFGLHGGGFGGTGQARSLLTPVQVRAVKTLARHARAPVYDLAYGAVGAHRSIARYARGESGGIFFVNLKVLQALEAAAPAAREERLEELGRYLESLRDGVEGNYAGAAVAHSHEDFLKAHPAFAAWAVAAVQ